MRILFTRFPLESAHGGAENQTMWLASGLREKGHDVSFLGSCPVLLQTFHASGFQAQKLEIGPPPVTKWFAASFFWRRSAMLTKLIQSIDALEKKPDVVVMLSLTEKILLTPFVAAKGMRVVWIEHDRVGSWLTKNPWLPALKKASEHATMVCVSMLSKKLYVQHGFEESRIVAIPNAVPAPSHLAPRQVPEQGILRLGTVARLSPEKGIDVLIEAIADMPEVSLTIIGSGPDEGYLRTLVQEDTKRMGGERISIVRSVPDLHSFYESIDAFILPSKDHDPFGLVAAEAMIVGVPTIVTDMCGIASSLRSGMDALVVPAEDPLALKNAIHSLFDSAKALSLAESGTRTAREAFSLPRMVAAYEALFLGSPSTHISS